jgi:cyclase
VELGAGEIMLTSINNEGTGRGFDLELIRKISMETPVPLIACGGAGTADHCVQAAVEGGASAVSASSIFHYHYANPVTSKMLKSRYFLRKGKQIDTGDMSFAYHGYGGIKELQVKPTSIAAVKKALEVAGLRVRKMPEVLPGNG